MLWEGANPNLQENQRFTLKISLACKAGARECRSSLAEVCLPGMRCLCPRLQRPGGLEGPFFSLPAGTIALLRGWSWRNHSKANKCKAAASGRAPGGRAGSVGSPRGGGTPLPRGLLSQHREPAPAGDAGAPHCCPRATARNGGQSTGEKRLPLGISRPFGV